MLVTDAKPYSNIQVTAKLLGEIVLPLNLYSLEHKNKLNF